MTRYAGNLTAVAATVFVLAAGCAPAGDGGAEDAASAEGFFAELQERGEMAMGVDQYSSMHRFDALADGGRIELQMAVDDSAGVEEIRRHLAEIAQAFESGDFSTPAFVHDRPVPGTDVMSERREVITYTYNDLPRGGEVRITTRDPAALEAIRAFMDFQRRDHRAGGMDHGSMDHGTMDHGTMDHGSMDHMPGPGSNTAPAEDGESSTGEGGSAGQ